MNKLEIQKRHVCGCCFKGPHTTIKQQNNTLERQKRFRWPLYIRSVQSRHADAGHSAEQSVRLVAQIMTVTVWMMMVLSAVERLPNRISTAALQLLIGTMRFVPVRPSMTSTPPPCSLLHPKFRFLERSFCRTVLPCCSVIGDRCITN